MQSSGNQTTPQLTTVPPLSELLVGYVVLSCLVALVLPIPSWFLDIVFGFNLVSSIVVLLVSFYIKRPSEFSSLPLVILLGCFFRLAIGVAFLRVTLVKWYIFHHAKVPAPSLEHFEPSTWYSLTQFLGGGNLIIGIVITGCLLLLIPALVGGISLFIGSYTKAINQLSGPEITPDEIQDNHGCHRLNGASRLLLIESGIGILILVLLIGLMEWGRIHAVDWGIPITTDIKRIVSFYFELSTQELLIRQMPLLLMAISIGIVVCQPARQAMSLGPLFFQEIQNKPYAVLFASIFSTMLAISGLFGFGLPWWVFLPISLLLAWIAFSELLANDVQAQLKQFNWLQSQISEQEHMYDSHAQPTLVLELPDAILAEFRTAPDPETTSLLFSKRNLADSRVIRNTPEFQLQLLTMKRQLFDTLGYIIPTIAVHPSQNPDNQQIRFLIHGRAVMTDTIDLPDDNSSSFCLETLIPTIQEALIANAPDILTRKDTQKLLDTTLKEDPALISELLSRLDIGHVRQILSGLIQAKISIRNLRFIVERLCDSTQDTREPEQLISRLKTALSVIQ